jgi:hypothetical protein
MTHGDLVQLACRWLAKTRRCKAVFADVQTMKLNEFPDAIGFNFGYTTSRSGSTVIEAKTSVADFKRDASKRWKHLGPGMGRWRFYLCPEYMLGPRDIPDDHGLIYALESGKLRVVRDAPSRSERDVASELSLLTTMVQRHQLGVRWDPKTYTFETRHETERRKATEGAVER